MNTTTTPVLAADGKPLKASLAKALRRQKLRALLLIAPLLAFVIIGFIVPIFNMLLRSVDNEEITTWLPNTTTAIAQWDSTSGELPDEAVYAALAVDIAKAAEHKKHTNVGRLLNYQTPGIASTFRKSGRKVQKWDIPNDGPYKEKFLELDKGWGKLKNWQTIHAMSSRYTDAYYLAAIDAKRGPDGIALVAEDSRIYSKLMIRTIGLSLLITLMTVLLGYPVAWLLANLKDRTANMLMILVLLPFWTSLLVRTSAWKVLLQREGVINDFLVWVGVVDNAARLQLINNQFGTVTAMTHILLPFMILPLYSVMKTIPHSYVRAAKSLGANDWTAFWRVYFPQSIPGIGAGAILVFILAIGYYITPELVGGSKGTFISNRIAYQFSSTGNWGLAAALGSLLLILVLGLYWLYDKIVGIDNVKLG